MISKHHKLKETHTKTYYSKIVKSKDKKRLLKEKEKGNLLCTEDPQ